jgi:hypothetical protein
MAPPQAPRRRMSSLEAKLTANERPCGQCPFFPHTGEVAHGYYSRTQRSSIRAPAVVMAREDLGRIPSPPFFLCSCYG